MPDVDTSGDSASINALSVGSPTINAVLVIGQQKAASSFMYNLLLKNSFIYLCKYQIISEFKKHQEDSDPRTLK